MLVSGTHQSRFARLCGTIAVAIALVGCGGSSSGGRSSGGDAYASFRWGIYDIEDTGNQFPLTCGEAGASQVVLTLMNQATQVSYPQNAVPCSATEASTAYVPAGDYSVGFDLYGDSTTYGNATALLDSFDSSSSYRLYPGANDYRNTTPPFVVQSLLVDWGITFQGRTTTCVTMGARYVDLEFTVGGNSPWITSRFDCTTVSAGTSFPIPLGTPSVQWRLFLVDSSSQDIASLTGGTVGVPSRTNINLGTQYFDL